MNNESPTLASRRKLILHIGSDKAGSTALQIHLAANRELLETHGVYVPRICGADVTGHHGVFLQDFSEDNINKLVEEIDERPEDDIILMSWEGIHVLEENFLKQFRAIFDTCTFQIIFYVREQAEVIQTGYLQEIKGQERSAQSIFDAIDYTPQTRDYYHTIKKFEAIFDGCSSDVILYDRSQFPQKNIIYDFFPRIAVDIGLNTITTYQSEINSSLSLKEVHALAGMENLKPELNAAENRGLKSRVIDLLLSGEALQTHGTPSFFLTRDQVDHCRNYFRESNKRLIDEYCVNDILIQEQRPVWRNELDPSPADAHELEYTPEALEQILDLAACPYMDRDSRTTYKIPLNALLSSNWQPSEQPDRWECGSKAAITGALRLQSLTPMTRYLRFFFRGNYINDAEHNTSVYINGNCVGDFDLRACSFQYLLEKVGFPYTVTLELVHRRGPDSQQAVPATSDTTAYRLINFVCTYA